MNKMKVEIWSDVMCPFCWIGKHLYEKALSQFPDKDNIETEWMSYQLDPDIPETMDEKVTTSEYLSERKGNADSSLNISSGQSCSIDGKCE